MSMAKERERVFSLSRFSTMADDEQQQESAVNVFSRIYGAPGFGDSAKQPFGGDDDQEDTGYVEPARTSYPEN